MDAKRQKLLDAALGPHFGWTAPSVVATIGPHEPSIFEEYDRRRQGAIAALAEKLHGYSDDEIEILLEAADDPANTRGDWRTFCYSTLKRIGPKPPPWYAAGFGHTDHVADFDYWSRMATLTIDELLCLSLGVNPASFPPATIQRLLKDDIKELWPALQFLLRRREQMARRFPLSHAARRIPPRHFLAWVDQVAFDVHPEFLRLLRQHGTLGGVRAAMPTPAAPLDKREVDTIAQLFTAMAIDHLGYDPKQSKSPTPKEITEIAASLGLTVSPETVRKYLKIGASFISPDWRRD